MTNLLSLFVIEKDGIISNNNKLFSYGIDTVEIRFKTLNLGPYT